ncbi:MAG TPA: hypothetical protein VK923_18240 [Euzebyales bacterium]|nr:hypothetical protein [Euzebyales bacterium]
MHRDNEDDAANDLRRWLGEDNTSPSAGHDGMEDLSHRWTAPRLALALLVLAPWVVLGVLALTGARGPASTGRPDDAGPAGHATDDSDGPARAPMAGSTSPPSAPETRGHRADAATPTEAVTASGGVPAAVGPMAVRLVRDAVTRTGARSMALDAAVVEAAEALAADTWAVRVHAVILRGDRRRWRAATHEVWAAPVGLREGRVVGLDQPWRVATIDGGIAPTTWDRADVDTAAVRGALDDAGISHGDDPVVHQHPKLPSIVRVTTSGDRHVWVRLTPQPVVVGHGDGRPDR